MTLPELTLVAVIIVVAVAMAMPAYQSWVQRSELRQGIVELYSTLTLARMAAMNRNRTTTVTLSLNGGRVMITTADGTAQRLTGGVTLGRHVSAFTGGPVQFSSLGLRLGGPAGDQLITLTNNRGQTFSVRVSPNGKAEWCPQATCP